MLGLCWNTTARPSWFIEHTNHQSLQQHYRIEREHAQLYRIRDFLGLYLDLFDVNKCEKIFETHLGIMNSEQQIKKEWE